MLGGKPQQGSEHIPTNSSDQLGVQLNLLVGRPVQHKLIGDGIQLALLVHSDPHPGLVEDDQVQLVLLEVVQRGALVGDVAGQALAEAWVLLQGSHLSLSHSQ